MADRYQQLINSPVGRIVSKQIGLPSPVTLERFQPGRPVISGPVLLGASSSAALAGPVATVLAAVGAEVSTPACSRKSGRRRPTPVSPRRSSTRRVASADTTFKALIFDATGISDSAGLEQAYAFFHPTIRRIRASGRVLVLGGCWRRRRRPRPAVVGAARGLPASIGKEVRRGATAQLI